MGTDATSGQELERVNMVAPNLFEVVPGIRPAGSAVGDQKRVVTPAMAIERGGRIWSSAGRS